jgi:basic membrane protein A and related proteins
MFSTSKSIKHSRRRFTLGAHLLTATAALVGLAPVGVGAAVAADNVWTMITDQAGLGDHGFNDLAKLGLDMSAEKLGGRVQVIQSTDQSQFVPNLQQAVSNGSTVTTGVGFLLNDALTQVAAANPKAHFTLIDAVSVDKSGKPLDNVASVTFREQEGAFLAGIVAAMTTKTKSVGFVGGMETPPVVRFLSGYQAGVRYVNPDIKVSTAYVGSFKDPAKAKELALGIFDLDADVIMDVAGGGGRGIFDAAKGLGPDHWVIGADTCKQQLAPDNFLTSAVKDVAGAVYRENKEAAAGTFKGGPVSLGLKEDAVGLCKDNIASLSPAIMEKVKAATAAIDDGSMVVPATADQLKSFKPTAK